MSAEIQGYCPMGCGRTLFVGSGGYVTCSWVKCPRPDAAADILLDPQTAHVVVFEASGFTIRHPLRERLDDALMQCALHPYIAKLNGPPVQPGRYLAHKVADYWTWQRMVDLP